MHHLALVYSTQLIKDLRLLALLGVANVYIFKADEALLKCHIRIQQVRVIVADFSQMSHHT